MSKCIYRISLRNATDVRVPDKVKTITYAATMDGARAAALGMERRMASPTSCVVDIEVMTRVSGPGAAEWARVATLGARHPLSWDALWEDMPPCSAIDAMERNGDVYIAWEGPV